MSGKWEYRKVGSRHSQKACKHINWFCYTGDAHLRSMTASRKSASVSPPRISRIWWTKRTFSSFVRTNISLPHLWQRWRVLQMLHIKLLWKLLQLSKKSLPPCFRAVRIASLQTLGSSRDPTNRIGVGSAWRIFHVFLARMNPIEDICSKLYDGVYILSAI